MPDVIDANDPLVVEADACWAADMERHIREGHQAWDYDGWIDCEVCCFERDLGAQHDGKKEAP